MPADLRAGCQHTGLMDPSREQAVEQVRRSAPTQVSTGEAWALEAPALLSPGEITAAPARRLMVVRLSEPCEWTRAFPTCQLRSAAMHQQHALPLCAFVGPQPRMLHLKRPQR